jgi:CRISPR-associated endonuclease Csn1
MAAIYEGTDAKGKTKRTFEIISLFEAAQAYSKKAPLVPQTKDGFPLIKTIRLGDLVLLYENSQEEIYHASQEELVMRMYEIVGMSASGGGLQIKLKYQQEAKPNGELHQVNGIYKAGDVSSFRMLLYSQFNALVQGQDFNLSDTGKITFKSC